MKNFPGRTVEEIVSLAADMQINCPNRNDILSYAERIADFADDEIYNTGDHYMESVGYSLSTVRNCATKIANMLYSSGMVDIS